MKTRTLKLLPVVALLALSGSQAVTAQTSGACCAHSTSKLDALLNPVQGGDEKFFTSVSTGVPNVLFVFDNSGSMLDWPFPLCPGAAYNNNCNCEDLNDLGFSNAKTYSTEPKDKSGQLDKWFERDRFYEVRPRRGAETTGDTLNYGQPGPSGGPSGLLTYLDYDKPGPSTNDVCDTATDPAKCRSCLNPSTGKGYYFDADPAKDVMRGNFLNLFAPKYLMARKAAKETIREIRPIRLNIQLFWKNGVSSLKGEPPTLLQDWNPSCDHPESNFESNRGSMISAMSSTWFGGRTPLFRALAVAGWSFNHEADPVYERSSFGGSKWYETIGLTSSLVDEFDEASNANGRSVCNECSFSAILLFTDGEPNDAYENLGADGGTSYPLGAEIDVPGCTTCKQSRLDEMARWLWNNDLRPEYVNRQRIATYTIAFALENTSDGYKLLKSTASVGGGEFFSAKTGGELKQALLNAFESINSRNTAFSSANIASLQTGDSTLTAIIPRMRPQKNAPWSGLLYRFNQYNEFVADAEHPDDNDSPDAAGYKSDIFLVDSNNDIVVEDSETGAFVKRENTNAPATPLWEASDRLRENGHQSRKIWTVIDSTDPGVFSSADSRIEFKKENASQLLPYLGVSEPGLCPNVVTGDLGRVMARLAAPTSDIENICGGALADGGFVSVAKADGGLNMGQQEALECCAKVIIEWVRGRSITGLGDDGGSSTREDVLGDIFHSSPVTVEPPATRFLCDLGVSNQCVRTLYSQDLGGTAPTPIASASVSNACGTVANANAYDDYLLANYTRERLVVVGANDGMLHAFKSGTGTVDSSVCTAGWPKVSYGNGNGDEAWAFIPPDQLPRIHERIFGHTYYVDGDVMVRDIWADSNNDGTKQADEFHTMIIAAEGRGGPHYFALEAKWTSGGAATDPNFRWMYPQPCSLEASTFGKTLYSLSPKPPPVGPVLLGGSLNTSGDPNFTNAGSTNTVNRYGQGTTERWMVMLSGGWAPFLDKGRGLYMVDAWSAKVNGRSDNLWWKAEYTPGATGAQAPKAAMTHSFAAPVALVDYGQDYSPRLDGFFDLALAGDTRGQLWLARMATPARIDTTTRLINNWPIARVFEQDRGNYATHSITTEGLAVTSVNAKNTTNVWPFFYLPSAALQTDTGALRAFIGTGNRYAILDDGPGVCRFDNPNACSKRAGCVSIRQIGFNNRLDTNITRNENHWATTTAPNWFEHASFDTAAATNAACGAGQVVVNSGYTTREIVCASSGANAPQNSPPASLGLMHIQCGKRGVDGGFFCGRVDGGATFTDDYVMPDAGIISGLSNNKFYGVKAYGAGRYLSTYSDAGILTADQFDDLRYTDVGGDGGTQLVDVTRVSCSRNACDGGAPTNGPGWFYEYENINRKTASGSVVLAGCVLWSDLFPSTAGDGGCASSISAKSDLLQGDFITGAPNCAFGFLNADGGYSRLKTRDVVAPPPEPAMAIMIGPNQQIKYSAMVVEPGQKQATEVTISAAADVLQSIYELPINRELHRCRHSDAGCL